MCLCCGEAEGRGPGLDANTLHVKMARQPLQIVTAADERR